MQKTKRRNRKGAMLPLVAALTVVLSGIGLAILGLVYLVSGNREGSNANSSGTLNVAKMSVTLRVKGTDQENLFFGSTVESGHSEHYGLGSINRMWGRCMVIMLNAWSMQLNGTATPQSTANANTAWTLANSINARLSARLNDQKQFYSFFHKTAKPNSLRMYDADNHLVETGKWQTACVNRGGESGVIFNPQILPYPLTQSHLGADPTIKANGAVYMRGYTPLHVGNGRYINFVSFESQQQPHLVSQVTFDAATLKKNPIPTWQSPIPNAFRCTSNAANQIDQTHKWSAAGVANVMHETELDIKNGFVRIRLNRDNWRWYPNYTAQGHEDVAKGSDQAQASLNDHFWSGTYTAWGSCGAQYYGANGPSAYQALYSLGGYTHPMYADVNRVLLNRVNQIKPGTTMQQLVALLMNKRFGPVGDLIIALNREDQLIVAQDLTSDVGMLRPDVQANLGYQADGLPTKTYEHMDNTHSDVQATHSPVAGFSPDQMLIKKGTKWRHLLVYTPGTGAHGALLDIDQRDTTYALMVCIFKGLAPPVQTISDDGIIVPSPDACLH